MCRENIAETCEHTEYRSVLEGATQNDACGSWHWQLDQDGNMAFSGRAHAWVRGGAVGLQTGAQGYPIQSPSFTQMGSPGAKEGLSVYGFCLKCSRGTLQDVPLPYTFQPLSALEDTYIQMNPENQQFKMVLWNQPIIFLSVDWRWPFFLLYFPQHICPWVSSRFILSFHFYTC